MSRRSAPSWLARVPGEVYTLHFWPPYGEPGGQQAKHYTGWTRPGRVRARMTEHRTGKGARLTEVQVKAGGSFVLADVQPGTADRETQLKYRGASRRCGVCRAERDVRAGKITAGEALERAGWDRSTDYERGLLLEIFGLEAPPANLAVRERQPEPEPIEQHWPGPVTEITPEMDALVDELCATWRAEADAAADAAVTPGPDQAPELSHTEPFVPRPAPGEPSPEQPAEMDALADVAGWRAEAASPEGAEAEPELEAG
jgi:hypothetical protein